MRCAWCKKNKAMFYGVRANVVILSCARCLWKPNPIPVDEYKDLPKSKTPSTHG